MWSGTWGIANSKRFLNHKMNEPNNVVELLQALVRIPSVNPEGNPGVENPGEENCALYVADFLRRVGARVELQPVLPGRPNVIGVFPTDSPGKKRLVLAPHTDTVSVVGMTIDPFSGDVRDGRVWGRGASDTKGPMAAMLWALWELREKIATLPYEIWFAGLMGEEAGQHGAKAFVQAHPMDFALIGEPTGPVVVHTHKGACWLTLKTRGKAVHASTPERGENAIYKMVEVVRHLREVVIPKWALLNDPLLGSPTLSVGIINGGSKVNIVPDACEVLVDCRTTPAQNRDGFIDELLAEIRSVCPDIEASYVQSLPLCTDPAHPLIQLMEKLGAKPAGAPWFCDAAIFAAAGIPAVASGPGSIAQAHIADEFISVVDLEGGVEFYRQFLEQL